MKDDENRQRSPHVSRRNLIKMGAGVVASTLHSRVSAQVPHSGPPAPVMTPADWKNDSGRSSGNGAMDNTTRQFVEYARSFSESNLTEPVADALGDILVDCIGCVMTGFDAEPVEIAVRLARSTKTDLKSTVLGYGVTTSPELAGFAGSCMVRHFDFNDVPHNSDMIPGILAVGEALHASGTEVLLAIALGYEIDASFRIAAALGENRRGGGVRQEGAGEWGGWDQGLFTGPATAIAVGKLLGLNEDQLANALSLALVPHVPMRVTRSGTLSMWKGCAAAMSVRNGIFAAMMAREGMTGPSEPFEGRAGLWEQVTGPFKGLRFPASPDGQLLVQRMSFKPFPAESQSQAILEIIPQIRAWTKVDDIESILIEAYHHTLMEIGDAPKWDPRNSETADHSFPYLVAVALMDGEVTLSSYSQKRILDPALRPLMQKITIRDNPEFVRDRKRITVRTKAGAEWVKEVTYYKGHRLNPMTREELYAKFDRNCSGVVTDAVRDRARSTWSNLRAVRDIAGPIAALGRFKHRA